ncbi:hypothetical protein CBFG_02473 [Clostridiales bacterium 1_7_47FAA]|nr:hypothetical protein CBFG_02473 [Clostridiales bacterium 1_7_47FAA]
MCCKKVFTGYLYHRKNGIWLFNVQFWYFIETGWLGQVWRGQTGNPDGRNLGTAGIPGRKEASRRWKEYDSIHGSYNP